ncbi:uroporphyrin-III C-methyltransferase, partial [Lactobacillus delbrueckii subsp. bulgaricus]
MSTIKTVRIYAKEQPAGYRILVDRLWPRGIKKEAAN